MSDELQTHWSSHCAAFGVSLSTQQLEQFERYANLLIEGNTRTNLTRIVGPAEIRIRHFLDSVSVAVLPDWQPNGCSLVDVGTGAGLPGLALAIAFPKLQVTLIESVQKKTAFLTAAVDDLKLPNVRVLPVRAEDAGRDPELRETFDYAVARSVARLPVLLEYLLPFVRIGGQAIAWKGETVETEAADSAAALRELGACSTPAIQQVQLPQIETNHYLVSVKKEQPTPEKYPRRAGIPSKRPLSE